MARKLCTVCNIRAIGTGGGDDADSARGLDMCNPCYTEGGWENSHDDNAHEGNSAASEQAEIANCWICHPELNLATAPARKGHTNTVAKSHTSHAGHNHPRTPYYRSLCRRSMAAGHGAYDADAPKV